MPTMLRDRLVRGERGDGKQKAGDDSDDSGGGEGEEKERKKGLEIMNGDGIGRVNVQTGRQAARRMP